MQTSQMVQGFIIKSPLILFGTLIASLTFGFISWDPKPLLNPSPIFAYFYAR